MNSFFSRFVSCILLSFVLNLSFAQEKTKVLLDADTANEVDDLFALARILMEPSVEVIALNATQWQASHWTTPNSMEDSHRLNQMLLGVMGLSVKTNRGGAARMYDWGDRARHSAAAYEIIKQTKLLKEGEKLNIIALGALTNVASAVFIDPEIAPKLKLYWLGSSYDFEEGILLRNDFNCAMDQYAFTHLLFSKVEMHIVPVNVAAKMQFKYDETRQKLEGHFLGDYLLKIWDDHIDSGRRARTIWDLSIVDAFINPEWAEEVQITTSKDNGNRNIYYYRDFDADRMRKGFFQKITAYKRP
ncbi:nucleoside hydrolase [Flavobacteriaceae bacterium TP-CH-4]|uniref:Nucleoside hydrolase n=1 Tax=Pelagihabitans pacificus TaxID=2696054 RepID=A0A967AYS3_9FLAO|nr:nucleoside hydrolase [Pelagihabitans pacificus]NHF60057.1 nucleoside hydrolase [Pelagihabitans pacificus]